MKIVAAPDSFKGSLTSLQAAQAIANGVKRAYPKAYVDLIPLADGGEGFTEAVVTAAGGSIIKVDAADPLGRRITSFYGWIEESKTAVVEAAAASGLTLVKPEERNPSASSTFGTGELIRAALDRDAETILIGLGGSGTNDGGIGMAQALGYRFADGSGNFIAPFDANWLDIAAIDASQADPRLRNVDLIAACDVDAVLYGERGASAVFGPQKGATPAMVKTLDLALRQLAVALERDLGVNVHKLAGGGAAGGLGAGLTAFCGAGLRKGIDIVLDACQFDERIKEADLIITGEGRTDGQTAMGKTAAGAAARGKVAGVPVVCISGSLDSGYEELTEIGIHALFSVIPKPVSLDEAMEQAENWLTAATEQVIRLFMLGRGTVNKNLSE